MVDTCGYTYLIKIKIRYNLQLKFHPLVALNHISRAQWPSVPNGHYIVQLRCTIDRTFLSSQKISLASIAVDLEFNNFNPSPSSTACLVCLSTPPIFQPTLF